MPRVLQVSHTLDRFLRRDVYQEPLFQNLVSFQHASSISAVRHNLKDGVVCYTLPKEHYRQVDAYISMTARGYERFSEGLLLSFVLHDLEEVLGTVCHQTLRYLCSLGLWTPNMRYPGVFSCEIYVEKSYILSECSCYRLLGYRWLPSTAWCLFLCAVDSVYGGLSESFSFSSQMDNLYPWLQRKTLVRE